MVLIDTVYQRVLSIANKEQRGYITPLEFNLLANQASLAVFEQYFYSIDKNERLPGNSRQYSDIEHIMNEKIAPFELSAGNSVATVVAGGHNLPADLYMLGQVIYQENGIDYHCEEITSDEFLRIRSSPLLAPTNRRPVYIKFLSTTSPVGYGIRVYGDGGAPLATPIWCNYIKLPNKVEWGYDVVNEKALYNATPGRTVDFEHHPSEETTLVLKILELAGVIIQDSGIIQYADQEELKKLQQEKT